MNEQKTEKMPGTTPSCGPHCLPGNGGCCGCKECHGR